MNDQEFNQALHKYRDEAVSHPLDFRPSLERLMDSQHCQELVKVFNHNAKWERTKAVESLGDSLPDARGVYMFVWRPSLPFMFEAGDEHLHWVLYIGKAGKDGGTQDTIRSRYQSEYKRFVGGDVGLLWDRKAPREREDRLARYLALRPLEYWFLLLEKPGDITILERKLIKLLSPPLNRQHAGPRLTAGSPVPAFEEIP